MEASGETDACAGIGAILRAATELFARSGFDGVSIADIAAAANVCKANVFYHFASKEALYLAVMRRISDEHAQLAESLLDKPGPCVAKLRDLFAYEMRHMLKNDTAHRLSLRELGSFKAGKVRNLVHKIFERNFRAVIALFEQGQQSGELRRDFTPAVASLLWGGAKTFYFQLHEELQESGLLGEACDAGNYAQQAAELLIAALLAQPEPSAKKKSRPARGRRA
jgi:TetR/AcrR family transcriptional regulator